MDNKELDKLTKKYGFRKDQKGIFNRYVRESKNWESHLRNSQIFILKSLPVEVKSIAVLGSGWLLDFPLKEILQENIKIDLFDLYHPNQIQKIAHANKLIRCNTVDLTDGFFDLFLSRKKHKEKLTLNDLIEYQANVSINLSGYSNVISLNILSQLGELAIEKLPLELDAGVSNIDIVRSIQRKHISYLPEGKTTLITDYLEQKTSEDNKVIEERKLIPDIDPLKPLQREEWLWIFDTKKYYYSDYKTNMKVIAMRL